MRYILYYIIHSTCNFRVLKYCLTLVQAITTSGTKKGELFVADLNTQLKNRNVTTDLKVDTKSNVSCFLSFT